MADLTGTRYKYRTDNLHCSFLQVFRPRQEW